MAGAAGLSVKVLKTHQENKRASFLSIACGSPHESSQRHPLQPHAQFIGVYCPYISALFRQSSINMAKLAHKLGW